MLNSNQSNRNNIWKFGIILPFVTAFMLLFQIETIAQEKFIKEAKTNYGLTTSFSSIVTKNTTDKDLEVLEKIFSDENQKLSISNVKRNESNEITAIKLVFDSGKTYNEVFERKSTSPIDDIKIFVNKDKNNRPTCGFLEISTTSEKANKGEVIEVDEIETSDNQKYFSLDNMTKNGKEVVLIVNGKIKGLTEKMKIPYDEELGEMKEITPAEFEKKYHKNANSNRYYYEVETVKFIHKEKNVNNDTKKIQIDTTRDETEKKVIKSGPYDLTFKESNQSYQIEKIKKDKNVDAKKALLILNEKEINYQELDKIDSNLIASVSVMRATKYAMEKYGEKAKNGVIIIQTKEFFEEKQKK